jgi:hypothetical protein
MKHVLPLLAVAVATTGCLNERTYVNPEQSAGIQTSNLNLQDGRMRGDFGPRRGFDGIATEMQGASDREWNTSTVTIARSEGTRGTGMVILWTNQQLLENLPVGAHDFRYDPSSLDPPAVAANVCSGGDTSSIDYDRPADNVTLLVSQTPGGRQYELHTETEILDAMDGRTGTFETSDTTFVVGPSR